MSRSLGVFASTWYHRDFLIMIADLIAESFKYQTPHKCVRKEIRLTNVGLFCYQNNKGNISRPQTPLEMHTQSIKWCIFPSARALNQTSASTLNLEFKILTKLSFRISTKIKLYNLYKTSAAKWWTNSSIKILPELRLQNYDQSCAQSLNKSLALGPNVSSQICNKLLPTWSSASTWGTVTTSTSLSWHLHTPGSHQSSILNVTEWVSQLVTDEGSQWSDSLKIIIKSIIEIWTNSGRKTILLPRNYLDFHL